MADPDPTPIPTPLVPAHVGDLVARFEQDVEAYHAGRLNETELRRFYLDPLFTALGWDVDNSLRGRHEVRHEDRVRVGGRVKAPDYGFYLGHHRKFLVEAKKPAVDIHGDASPAYQLRRYGWNAKVPLAILTDFEELAVYDCRVKPAPGDPPALARILYFRFGELPARWGDLAALFGREAVAGGSIERFAGERRRQTGILEVDVAFLLDLERWRDALARNIALRNADLSIRELNEAVQKTLDRVIFLRICEDRGIEAFGRLEALQNGANVYERMTVLFGQADARYNSGLFHFRDEKGRAEAADGWMLGLAIDDRVLKEILRDLYPPASPYDFAVMPADILGSVYERFLGKTIRLTPAHRAVVEEKPEVRKAGGVYYTPTTEVEAIVLRTVGRALAGRKPADIDGSLGTAPLRIADPACGSGSFLIGAYQHLLDWYLDAYVAEGPEKRKRQVYAAPEWRLTTAEKKRILLTHIFGVDIDRQAVEVTKLSLMLKVLEGETEASLMDKQLQLIQERVLPDLGANIQCGNSLIGPAFYQSPDAQLSFLDAATEDRINLFDWRAGFPDAMRDGGFDMVIGNPPYVRIQTLKEWAPVEVEYYKRRYRAAGKGNYDIYVVFVERGLDLLNARGRLGYILPHKFFNAKYGEPLRDLLATGHHLAEVIHFGDQQVFTGATTYTCLMFLDKAGADALQFTKVDDLPAWRASQQATATGAIPAAKVTAAEWNFVVSKGAGLFERLGEMPVKLGDVAERIFQGLVTSCDPVYVLDTVVAETPADIVRVRSKASGEEYELERAVVHPLCKGSLDIRRFHAQASKYIVFPYRPTADVSTSRSALISPGDFAHDYPRTWEYLLEHERTLRHREKGKMNHAAWYGYVYPKSITLFAQAKILTPSIAIRPSFTFDAIGQYYFIGSGGGGGGGYGILLTNGSVNYYHYILGLLNSKLIEYLMCQISTTFRGGYLAYNRQYITQLPIRPIDFTSPTDVARHDQMVALVQRMLGLHRELAAARSAYDKAAIGRRIAATDGLIDGLVYELYALTDAERRIVEERGQ